MSSPHTAGGRKIKFGREDVEQLMTTLLYRYLRRSAPSAIADNSLDLAELAVLGRVYEETGCSSSEAAMEGFRLGWECGSLAQARIAITNRRWRRHEVEVEWCAIHGVATGALELVASLFASVGDVSRASRVAFELGYEASRGPDTARTPPDSRVLRSLRQRPQLRIAPSEG